MLILIAVVAFCAFLYARAPRIERSSDVNAFIEVTKPDVRAYVDGKLVKSYLKE